jgi:hypothetical protein
VQLQKWKRLAAEGKELEIVKVLNIFKQATLKNEQFICRQTYYYITNIHMLKYVCIFRYSIQTEQEETNEGKPCEYFLVAFGKVIHGKLIYILKTLYAHLEDTNGCLPLFKP